MLLALVAHSLESAVTVRLLRAATAKEAADMLTHNRPDVLLYDLDAALDSAILPLLLQNPRLLLIGLDVETNRAVLLSKQERRCLTLDQVKTLVEGS